MPTFLSIILTIIIIVFMLALVAGYSVKIGSLLTDKWEAYDDGRMQDYHIAIIAIKDTHVGTFYMAVLAVVALVAVWWF